MITSALNPRTSALYYAHVPGCVPERAFQALHQLRSTNVPHELQLELQQASEVSFHIYSAQIFHSRSYGPGSLQNGLALVFLAKICNPLSDSCCF